MDGERPSWRTVCALSEIEEPGARGFVFERDGWPFSGFVVRKAGGVHGYVNTCPHAGHPLNWKPHAFLTKDRALIMCSAHGAVFEIETGLCVAGPCPGRRLQALPVRVDAGLVQVDVPSDGDSACP